MDNLERLTFYLLNLIVVATCTAKAAAVSNFRTDSLDFNKSRLVVIDAPSSALKYFSTRAANESFRTVYGSSNRSVNSVEFNSKFSSTTLDVPAGTLFFTSQSNGMRTRFGFVENKRASRFELVEIVRSEEKWSHNDGDYGDTSDSSGISATPNAPSLSCSTGSLTQLAATCNELRSNITLQSAEHSFEDTKSIDASCESSSSLVADTFKSLFLKPDLNAFSVCLDKQREGEAAARVLDFARHSLPGAKVMCSDEATSRTDDYSTIILGKDFSSASNLDGRKKVLMHELLHVGKIRDHGQINDLIECCAAGSDGQKSCDRYLRFKDLIAIFSNHKDPRKPGFIKRPYDGISELIRSIAASSLSLKESKRLAELIWAKIDDAKQRPGSKAEQVSALNREFVGLCESKVKVNCSKVAESLNLKENVEAQVRQISTGELVLTGMMAKNEMSANIGKVPAAASSETGPPVPQNLEVRPMDANRLARVRDQMEEYSKPYRAVTEQLGTATRSLVANIAPVSPAVASPPTRRLVLNSRSQSSESSGAFSATVTSVRGNELQIQLPDGSTASGWIPFSKTGFGTPQIKVEPPSAGGGSRVSAGSLGSSDEVGTSARKPKGSVPGRLPSEGGATGAGGQTQASGGRGGASSSVGGGSSSVTRSPSSGGGGDLNFSTQKQQEISRLKLQLVRAQDPLQAIKSHIEDLRRNSMMVIYNGQQYPPDLQNPETTIDLNRYRGNR